jgi:hypothetical protein
MNGSSQLEEADRKPFALCPVCLRKLSYYFGFEGEELSRYTELKEVFKYMNHGDTQQNFKREIKLFDKLTTKLARLNEQFRSDHNFADNRAGGVSENEGGELRLPGSEDHP